MSSSIEYKKPIVLIVQGAKYGSIIINTPGKPGNYSPLVAEKNISQVNPLFNF